MNQFKLTFNDIPLKLEDVPPTQRPCISCAMFDVSAHYGGECPIETQYAVIHCASLISGNVQTLDGKPLEYDHVQGRQPPSMVLTLLAQ